VARAGGSLRCLILLDFEPWSFVIPSGWDWSAALTWVPDNQVSFFIYHILFIHPYKELYFPEYNLMINKAICIIVSVAYKCQMLLNTKSRKDQLLTTSYNMKNDFMIK
jgi:hypothetical protein